MKFAVDVRDLAKIYGKTVALDRVSFNVYHGEVFGLIGPNGAGKTTTLRILSTLIKPTSGIVRVFGYDVVSESSRVRELISYLPEEAGGYRYLSGLEYLRFMAGFYVKNGLSIEDMIKNAIEISGLGNRLKDKVKTYSKGMLRRLLLARALMVKPKLAILDEPTSGLDVIHASYVRKIIRDYASRYGVTVIVSSHNMLEIEFLCDRVALIDKGRILEIDNPERLKNKYNVENLEEVFLRATMNG
ncbi:MAG: ABC transporter ATP-binding protein [Candidatus Methanomethylicia archaeon]